VLHDEGRFSGYLVRRLGGRRDGRLFRLDRRRNDLGAAAAANAPFSSGGGNRFRSRRSGRASSARGDGRRGLLFGAHALLAFPARSQPRDLIVGEQTQMAANRNVHLTKKPDYFVRRDTKFASHVVHAKLAQSPLLQITSANYSRRSRRRAREFPARAVDR
jgi:hypothetical protein